MEQILNKLDLHEIQRKNINQVVGWIWSMFSQETRQGSRNRIPVVGAKLEVRGHWRHGLNLHNSSGSSPCVLWYKKMSYA